MVKTNQRLGDLLVERNLIQESDLERALHLQQQTGGRIGVPGPAVKTQSVVTLSSQLHEPGV